MASRRSAAAAAWLAAAAVVCVSPAHAGDAVETSGDLLRVAIPAFAAAMTYKRDDREGRRQFLRSFGANVAATWALQSAVDKETPDGTAHDAFPSGHTSMSFQGAAFIHRRYGIRKAWPAYVLATYVGWTRVDADQHDAADVAAGAALGIASSMLLTKRWEDLSVATVLDRDALGIQVSRRF